MEEIREGSCEDVSITLTQAAHPRVVLRPATLNGTVDLAQHWGFPSSEDRDPSDKPGVSIVQKRKHKFVYLVETKQSKSRGK